MHPQRQNCDGQSCCSSCCCKGSVRHKLAQHRRNLLSDGGGPAGRGALGPRTAHFQFLPGHWFAANSRRILAAKWGPKKVVTIGIMLCSLSALSVAFASFLLEAAVLRFLVGAGMAFVFSPSIVIAAKYLGQHRSGINVGLFNSAFGVGGIFGIFGWASTCLRHRLEAEYTPQRQPWGNQRNSRIDFREGRARTGVPAELQKSRADYQGSRG